MKSKIVTIIMAVIMAVSCCGTANAEVIVYKKYKDFKYVREGKWAGIYYYNGKKSKAVVPAKIKGVKVDSVNLIRAKGLKRIRLPRYAKHIGLSEIPSLKKVTVDPKNKYLSVKNNMVLNKKKTRLVSVLGGYEVIKIPKTVKTLESASFYKSNIKKVIITKNVKRIESPFQDCEKLETVVFEGNSIPQIREKTFGDCEHVNFYVKTEKLAEKLLRKLRKKHNIVAHIYVGDKLIYEEQLHWDNW